MKRFVIFFSVLFWSTVSFCQNTEWIAQPISGSVTVYFPAPPGRNDTIGQIMYFLNDGKDLLLATVAPIPANITAQNHYNQDSVLNNFIQSVIANSTQLIFSEVQYKGLASKYYKVRVDEDDNPIKGLIADAYNFIHKDTIYSFSYLRYDATEMYDYNKQRMFFDMVEVKSFDHAGQVTSQEVIQTAPLAPIVKDSKSKTMNFISIAVLILGILLLIFRIQNRKNKGHFD